MMAFASTPDLVVEKIPRALRMLRLQLLYRNVT